MAIASRSNIALHRCLVDLGVPSDLHVYAGRDHEFDRAPSMATVTTAATASFLRRFVTDRKQLDKEARRFPFPPSDNWRSGSRTEALAAFDEAE